MDAQFLMTLVLMVFSIIRGDNRFQIHAQNPIPVQAGQRVNYASQDLNHTTAGNFMNIIPSPDHFNIIPEGGYETEGLDDGTNKSESLNISNPMNTSTKASNSSNGDKHDNAEFYIRTTDFTDGERTNLEDQTTSSTPSVKMRMYSNAQMTSETNDKFLRRAAGNTSIISKLDIEKPSEADLMSGKTKRTGSDTVSRKNVGDKIRELRAFNYSLNRNESEVKSRASILKTTEGSFTELSSNILSESDIRESTTPMPLPTEHTTANSGITTSSRTVTNTQGVTAWDSISYPTTTAHQGTERTPIHDPAVEKEEPSKASENSFTTRQPTNLTEKQINSKFNGDPSLKNADFRNSTCEKCIDATETPETKRELIRHGMSVRNANKSSDIFVNNTTSKSSLDKDGLVELDARVDNVSRSVSEDNFLPKISPGDIIRFEGDNFDKLPENTLGFIGSTLATDYFVGVTTELYTRSEFMDNASLEFSNETFNNDSASAIMKILHDISWPVKKEAVVEGDIVLGGLMMVHEREDHITCGPIMPQGGIQALEAMLYTLDRLNEAQIPLLPNITLGAHILDDCDKDTYGLEMAVDFIKGKYFNL